MKGKYFYSVLNCIGSGGIRCINQGHIKQCSSTHIFSEMCLSGRHFTVTNSSESSVTGDCEHGFTKGKSCLINLVAFYNGLTSLNKHGG